MMWLAAWNLRQFRDRLVGQPLSAMTQSVKIYLSSWNAVKATALLILKNLFCGKKKSSQGRLQVYTWFRFKIQRNVVSKLSLGVFTSPTLGVFASACGVTWKNVHFCEVNLPSADEDGETDWFLTMLFYLLLPCKNITPLRWLRLYGT